MSKEPKEASREYEEISFLFSTDFTEKNLLRVLEGPGEGYLLLLLKGLQREEGDLLLVFEGDLLYVVEGPGEAHLLLLLKGLQREDGDPSRP